MTYKEKANLVMSLNKRMRDIVNKSGFDTAEFTYWENRIQGGAYKTLQTTEAYTGDDQTYHLLSRSRKDIESYSEEELLELRERTRTWSEIKKKAQQAMNEQGVEGGKENVLTGEKTYSMNEIKSFLSMRKTINEWFEENADLVYALLEKTGWADIHQKSNEEIYKALQEIKAKNPDPNYSEEQRDRIRATYRAKRRKMEARKELQKKYAVKETRRRSRR